MSNTKYFALIDNSIKMPVLEVIEATPEELIVLIEEWFLSKKAKLEASYDLKTINRKLQNVATFNELDFLIEVTKEVAILDLEMGAFNRTTLRTNIDFNFKSYEVKQRNMKNMRKLNNISTGDTNVR